MLSHNVNSSHNHKIKVGFQGRKIPSVLLLNNDGSFNSFGSNAIQLLSSIDVIECENFRCFKAFKNKMISTVRQLANFMLELLFEILIFKNDSRAPLIRTTTGEFWPAKTVFSHSLACLKHEVFLEIQDTYGPIEDESLITWVITVPALWKHNAKQLIREAAYEVLIFIS